MIEIRDLTKRYRGRAAVDGLSFDVSPGTVTGFLGPNGAGKTTTLRVLLGLADADGGSARLGGHRYRDLHRPLCHVGALLDGGGHPGRTARGHLRGMAAANGIGRQRVEAVLDEVGLASVARRRIGGFSLGMRQRLGIAAALLGDPATLVFDEPVNGLDPDGVRWLRELLRRLAGEGRTVLLSSHLMSEMELTADRLVVIGRGRLVADTSVAELAARFSQGVSVRTPDPDGLSAVVAGAGGEVATGPDGAIFVSGMDAASVAEAAAARGVILHEVATHRSTLEDAYLRLTADSLEYSGGAS
ncbi:ABC-2 type transport system ATP-binding protein [Stackebrandtia albiflava]|uniref:ABC-2 type transport system ATP-binding protein n=1 Tax=Stackebrandtia albiflava TaxID=406432 RepID=A0A562V551_9ACTN|nr:ATP-binding cassette domain-containing protein [Stackebrandtia albiflava]TWJ12937.1 ABC-2 type transport system ATP-binding protein [Stackebrandtia albiflava]